MIPRVLKYFFKWAIKYSNRKNEKIFLPNNKTNILWEFNSQTLGKTVEKHPVSNSDKERWGRNLLVIVWRISVEMESSGETQQSMLYK